MVTVEVDPVRVESRLAAGELSCPSCPDGVLARWGFGRSRRVVGLEGPVRPRRSRCRGCAATHVLLPVSLLLRRAYAAEVIWAVRHELAVTLEDVLARRTRALFLNARASLRMAPRVAYAALPDLAAGAYDQPSMWLARPDLASDPARYLPPGVAHERQGQAYVFFLHPTTFLGRNHWNAPIDHADSRMRAKLAVRSMASVFNDEAAVWAPRYRQAAMGTFLVDRPESQQALAVAELDARAAFATFLRSIPPGAPIVLAGHSQGALIATPCAAPRWPGVWLRPI